MARYIDADLEVSKYVTVWDCDCSEFGKQTVMAVDDLHYLPTADVAPRAEWISVEERLPDNNMERVLVFLMDDDFTKPIGDNKIDTDRFVDGKWVRWSRFVTHWMHLPEPPKGD